ncbi:MAG TPA: O-antigen ligase family protein [Vicinamibacterales bacterium]|nr:O-antigen ligase family protein [Vicinamibacterales bacterium]
MSERLAFSYGTGAHEVRKGDAGVGGLHRGEGRNGDVRDGQVRSGEVAPSDGRALAEPKRADWAWRWLLAFTIVLFFRPQDQIVLLAPLHLAEFTAICALTAMAFQRLRRGQAIVPLTPEFVGVAALGTLMALTIPFSFWKGGAFATFTDVYLKIIAIFVLMTHALRSPRRVERMTWVILLACGYLGFRAMLDYVRGVNLVEGGRVQGSIGGIFRNPNDLALNLVSYLPLAVFAAIAPGKTMKRAAAMLIAALMVGAVIFTQSRSGTIGLVIVVLITGAYALRRRPALVLAGLFVAAVSVPFLPASYIERMASITDEEKDQTGSREARQVLFREALQTFAERPLTGVGAGQFKNYNPPGRQETWRETHNALLQLATELGILGPLIMLFLVGRGLYAIREARVLLTRGIRAGIVAPGEPAVVWMQAHLSAMSAGLIGWFVCAQFASVAYNWTFYYVLALAAAPRELLIASSLRARLARLKAEGTGDVRLKAETTRDFHSRANATGATTFRSLPEATP